MAGRRDISRVPSGYDYDFVSIIDEDYICQICHLPLKQAVLTRCGHRFCNDCLCESFRRRQDPECPCDREKLDKDKDIFPDKASERRILSYMIRCPCSGCQWTGELRDVEAHEERCSYKVVECPSQHCNVKLARRLVEEHLATACPWRIICCPFCSESYPKSQEHVHNQSCPMFPLNCINGCEQVIPRVQMPGHLETVCVLTPLACPYHELGCTTKVERRDLERHIHDQTTSHLSLACKKLVHLQQEFDQEKTRLKKQIDDLKKENDSLVLKVSAQEKEILKTKIESPTFVWRISGFSEILRQAKHGKNKLDSAPFYTGPYGYRLKLSVNPNGDGSGKNTHLSAFVILMRGEYDGMLAWPFHQKVTFALVDQQDDVEQRENIVMHFRANTKLENFARPVSDENPGRGYARFVSHDKLKSRSYIVDDTLFIQVDVGPPSS